MVQVTVWNHSSLTIVFRHLLHGSIFKLLTVQFFKILLKQHLEAIPQRWANFQSKSGIANTLKDLLVHLNFMKMLYLEVWSDHMVYLQLKVSLQRKKLAYNHQFLKMFMMKKQKRWKSNYSKGKNLRYSRSMRLSKSHVELEVASTIFHLFKCRSVSKKQTCY